MRYLSVCSGIEAATAAWHPLGWKCVGFAEYEKFPSAVLRHHYPDVPNLDDMTKFKDWPIDLAPQLLVGGTPCQSFSVAGLRKGLEDPRGNLALTYCAILDRYKPKWFLWENVPGVLSTDGGRAFGSILGAMAELGYGWAYRVIDAQYVRVDGFGRAVPQRRRRVFVVGHLGNWRRAAQVLFERESLLWNSPPSRQAGQNVAPTISARTKGGGGLGTDFDCDGGLITNPVAPTMRSGGNKTGGDRPPGTDVDTLESLIAFHHNAQADQLPSAGRDTTISDPLTCSQGAAVAFAVQERAICENPFAGPNGSGVRQDGTSYTLEARTVPQAVAFQPRFARNDRGAPSEIAYPLTAEAGKTGKGDSAQCVATEWAVRRFTPRECERLQGFHDDYTAIPGAADGPRYKALGNSMAVNAMRWLGYRIAMVEATNVVDFARIRAALAAERDAMAALTVLKSRYA